jgi:DNA-binding winged helix-turn-helix (wHTH) protein
MQPASNSLNDTSEPRLVGLRFGPFELDVRSGELRRNGTTVRLQPQPLKVLLLLAGRPGEVVTREEIQADIWPAGTFVDFEQSLNFCIRQIRAALRDDANAPRYVETLPRRGYRWVAGPVQSETAPPVVREWPRPIAETPAPSVESSSGAVTAALPVAAPAARPSRLLPASLAILVGLVLVAVALWRQKPQEAASTPTFHRITFRRGSVNSARFAPDGQVVYSAAWEGGPSELSVSRSDGRDWRALDIKEAQVIGVSNSGEVAFRRKGLLARAPLAGGPAKEMLKDVDAADWTAEGRDFAISRWDVAKGKTEIEFPTGRVIAEAPARLGQLRVSPDGRYLAYTEHPVLRDDRGLVVVIDKDGKRIASTQEWASLEGLAWAPGGREVLFTAAESGAACSLRGLTLDGKVRLLLSGTGRFVLHDTAPDGRILLEDATMRSEVVFRKGPSGEDRDLSWLDYSAVVGISPSGDTLLFYESGEGGGLDYTMFLRHTDGSQPVRLGSGRALDLSPDGRYVISVDIHNPIALDLTPTGAGEIRHVRVPGITAHEDAGFLADGTRLFVTGRDASGKRATWLTDVEAKDARPLPLPEGRILRFNTFSSDGKRFVAPCPEGTYGSCFYDSLAGGPVPVPGAQKSWIAIGTDRKGRLYYREETKDRPDSLLRLEPQTGKVTKLAELAPHGDRAGFYGLLGVKVAADGEAWAFTFLRRLSNLHVVSGLK